MKAWDIFLKLLDRKLGPPFVDKWIRTLKVLKFDARNLYLDMADSFQLHYFNEYVAPMLSNHLLSVSGKPIHIHLTICGGPIKKKKTTSLKEQLPHFAPDLLEPQATFNTFILGKETHLSYTVLSEATKSPFEMKNYNPIYIYGPKGCGKSHLLMAAAHSYVQQGKKTFFVRSETFTEHVIRAFRSTKLQEFRKTYRNIDILLIDDVHLFCRKTATQEELFHTFNHLHTSCKLIILSSHAPPHLLEEVERRIINRFEWGITLPIAPPSLSIKIQVLKQRAQSLSLSLDPPLVEFFITNFTHLRSLVRALEALALRSPSHHRNIDTEVAHILLKDLLDEESQQKVTPEKILKVVASHFGIKVEDILGTKRNKEYAFPRKISMYLCRKYLNISFLKIGHLFSRDHSTVMTSIEQIRKGIDGKDNAISRPLHEIQRQLDFTS